MSKTSWKNISVLINDMSVRERKLLCMTSAAICMGIIAAVAWRPLINQWQAGISQHQLIEMTINSLQDNIAQLKKDFELDANAPYKAQLSNLQVVVNTQQNKIETITSALISPKNMSSVFSGLLTETALKLDKISNEDAEAVRIESEDKQTNLLFKHGLSLNMVGEYMNSLKYLQEIEQQEWKLYWDELTFSAAGYPNGKLALKVHTLSTSDNVLGF